ncbi:MAG: bifunctional hydroxymethylpyrimidine kinase/phosphomethylpyrimidine kinase, partial [Kiritimatiellae bacterium]|nr:bifunctional hydroxymethylpyrimidine kinase/phosphomethylpyrimidine kinase [Kiritimatiellia bacterium]
GCSLAASLAAELALGHALPDAVAGAKAFVHRAIATSYWVGLDCGVLGWGTDAPKPRITSQTAGE